MAEGIFIEGKLYPRKCNAMATLDLNEAVYVDRALAGTIWLIQLPEWDCKIPMFCSSMELKLESSKLVMLGKEQWFAPDAIVGIKLHQEKILGIYMEGVQKPIAILAGEAADIQDVYASVLTKLSADVISLLGLPKQAKNLPVG